MTRSAPTTSFTNALSDIRRRIEALERVAGSSTMAERMVTAFRDGVPPPLVRQVTVGNARFYKQLGDQLLRESLAASHHGLTVEGRSGDGLSHCLQWSREDAHARGAASLALATGFSPEPSQLQGTVFERARSGDRTLIDVLSQSDARSTRSSAVGDVQRLTRTLTPGGVQCLELLLDGARRNDLSLMVELLGWLRGDNMPSEWRRRHRLPARPLLSTDLRGLASALTILLRIFGMTGMLISIDESSSAEVREFASQFKAQGIVIVGSIATLHPRRTSSLILSELDSAAKEALALLLRDLHVHAYDWKRPQSLNSARIASWVASGPLGTTRDFVRYVVGRLDAVHAAE